MWTLEPLPTERQVRTTATQFLWCSKMGQIHWSTPNHILKSSSILWTGGGNSHQFSIPPTEEHCLKWESAEITTSSSESLRHLIFLTEWLDTGHYIQQWLSVGEFLICKQTGYISHVPPLCDGVHPCSILISSIVHWSSSDVSLPISSHSILSQAGCYHYFSWY